MPIDWSALWHSASDHITQVALDHLNTAGTSAHIPAQNAAGAQLADINRQYLAGTLSAAQAINSINIVTSGFVRYAQSLGYARALQGARDIQSVAAGMLQGIQSGGGGGGGGGGLNSGLLIVGGLLLAVVILGRK